MPHGSPNILFVVADDVGWFDPSCYNMGAMGYRTPNIDRIAHEGALFTDLYGQQNRNGGEAALITGQAPIRTGLTGAGQPDAQPQLSAEDPGIARFMKHFGYATGRFGDGRLGERDDRLPAVHGFDEVSGLDAATEFMDRHAGRQPWFCYVNTTRTPVRSRLRHDPEGRTAPGSYQGGIVELDDYVGRLLVTLEEVGVDRDTVVVFTTHNGAAGGPERGQTPFRHETDASWEGGWRVPCVVRWPGVIEPGRLINGIASLEDFIPTLAAASGAPDLVENVQRGYEIDGKAFRVHLDGVNLLPFLKGQVERSPRESVLYWNARGDLLAIRLRHYKIDFAQQPPKLYDLYADPFERGDGSPLYGRWDAGHAIIRAPAQALVAAWAESFEAFPPRAKSASIAIGQVAQRMDARPTGP